MKENNNLHIGIDVGSTTVKLAILDEENVSSRCTAAITPTCAPPSWKCWRRPRSTSVLSA